MALSMWAFLGGAEGLLDTGNSSCLKTVGTTLNNLALFTHPLCASTMLTHVHDAVRFHSHNNLTRCL